MDSLKWESLSPGEKKHALYLKEKDLLDTFLQHGAITQAQHDKSLRDLTESMGEGNVNDTGRD